jgi:D-beta-D-heptose 7-phosphate kinase / D-beta-D-heptose 1-phosphate adenosyltransferase
MSGLFVVGDCVLDVDLIGSVNALCPDAPAPVLDVDRERVRAGGAGLAARLAAADGVRVTLLTCLADDAYAMRLKARLAGVTTIVGSSPAGTAVRTRLLAGDRTIGRVDRGGSGLAAAVSVTEEMLDALLTADAVLVCDHGRGMTSNGQLRGVLTWLVDRVPVVWDAHPRGAEPVAGVAAATVDLADAQAATGLAGDTIAAGRAAAELRNRWQAKSVAVTLGAGGAVVDDQGVPRVVPANRVVVEDSYGAGHRFSATLAIRLMRGASVVDATGSAVVQATRFLADGGVAALHTRRQRSSLSAIA